MTAHHPILTTENAGSGYAYRFSFVVARLLSLISNGSIT